MTGRKKSDLESGADFDVGGSGALFKGLGNIFEVLGKLAEKGEELSKNGEITGLGDKVKGVYGFSIRSGLGGAPRVSSFGNIRKTPGGPVVEEVREPLVDLFDEEDYVLIVAELPGVEENDIKLDLKEDILNITSSHKDRKYAGEVLLPRAFHRDEMKYTYKNGILNITFSKK